MITKTINIYFDNLSKMYDILHMFKKIPNINYSIDLTTITISYKRYKIILSLTPYESILLELYNSDLKSSFYPNLLDKNIYYIDDDGDIHIRIDLYHWILFSNKIMKYISYINNNRINKSCYNIIKNNKKLYITIDIDLNSKL